MKRRLGIGLLALALVLVLGAGTPAQAKKGGNGGGGGGGSGGGGGEEPPADPAIAWTDTTGRSGSMWQVLIANADGSNVISPVPASGGGLSADPSWAPDGNHLVYRGKNTSGVAGLYVVAPDGTGVTSIYSGVSYDPKWSPTTTDDGTQRILFAGPTVDMWDLYVVTPAGADLVNLTQTSSRHETFPTWSPAADRIAARYADYNASMQVLGRGIVIYTLGTDSSGALAVTGSVDIPEATLGLTNVAWLDWARTQDKIACSAESAATSGRDIWVVSLATPSAPVNVTSTSGVIEKWPTWSPDDSQIAFSRYGNGKKDKGIFVQAASGSGSATAVVKGGGEHYRRPDWLR